MFALLILLASPRGEELAPTLKVELKQALKLDAGPTIGAGVYTVEWTGTEIVLSSTSQEVRVPAKSRAVPDGPRVAAVTLDKKTHRVVLSVRVDREEIVLPGEWAQTATQSRVGLGEDNGPVSLPASQAAVVEENDALATVWRTRFRPQLEHCVEKAERWSVQKYEKCVCPLVVKFRLPPTPGARRLALDERAVVSITLDNKGKVTSCALTPTASIR